MARVLGVEPPPLLRNKWAKMSIREHGTPPSFYMPFKYGSCYRIQMPALPPVCQSVHVSVRPSALTCHTVTSDLLLNKPQTSKSFAIVILKFVYYWRQSQFLFQSYNLRFDLKNVGGFRFYTSFHTLEMVCWIYHKLYTVLCYSCLKVCIHFAKSLFFFCVGKYLEPR